MTWDASLCQLSHTSDAADNWTHGTKACLMYSWLVLCAVHLFCGLASMNCMVLLVAGRSSGRLLEAGAVQPKHSPCDDVAAQTSHVPGTAFAESKQADENKDDCKVPSFGML